MVNSYIAFSVILIAVFLGFYFFICYCDKYKKLTRFIRLYPVCDLCGKPMEDKSVTIQKIDDYEFYECNECKEKDGKQ